MKVERYTPSRDLLAIVGDEWNGEFVVRQLTATEVLALGDELIDDMRKTGNDVQLVPVHRWNHALMRKASTFNGQPLPPDDRLPGKVMELLLEPALRLNTLTAMERQTLFLPSSTDTTRPNQTNE